MAINLDDYTCEFCGRPCKNLVYAAFVCDDPECLEKARIARGGPGGHMKRKAEGRPIIPEGLEEVAEELQRKSELRTVHESVVLPWSRSISRHSPRRNPSCSWLSYWRCCPSPCSPTWTPSRGYATRSSA